MNGPYAEMPLLDILNDLRSRELAVIAQYMRHHYLVTGPEGLALADVFKDIAVEEMKHAESIGERIEYLGGDPTTKPQAIATDATTLHEMAVQDHDAEMDAISRYRAAIKIAEAHSDPTTRRLLEEVLADEESHAKSFDDMLGGSSGSGLITQG